MDATILRDPRYSTLFTDTLSHRPVATKLKDLQLSYSYSSDHSGLDTPSWSAINALLDSNCTDYDFNAIPSKFLRSRATLRMAAEAADRAKSNPKAPWHIYNCPCCHEEVTLTYHQTEWHRINQVPYPRCPKCLQKEVLPL